MTLDDCYEKFLTGIKEYNNKDFFESHDTWEEIWHELRGTDRLFVQGLIHSAIGLYHLTNGNWKGARSQFEKCEKKLSAYLPKYRGLNVQAFLNHHAKNCQPLTHKIEKKQPVQLLDEIYPKIQLNEDNFSAQILPDDAMRNMHASLDQTRVELALRITQLERAQKETEKRIKALQEKFEQQIAEVQRSETQKRRKVLLIIGILAAAFLAMFFNS